MRKITIGIAALSLLGTLAANAETFPLWGRVSVYGSFQNTSFDSGASRDASEIRASVTLRSAQPEQSGFEYSLDLRGSAYPSAGGRDPRTRVFDAWAGGRTAGGRLSIRAGQMWLHDLGGLGSLGGVMAEMNSNVASGTVRYGLFAGVEPEIYDFGYVSGVKKGGAWVAFDGARARRHVLGYVQVRDESLTERSVVTTTNFLPVGQKFFSYFTAEYDLTGPGGEGKGGLNYVFANARLTPARRVELMANYHKGRSIDSRTITQDMLDGRPVDQRALDGFLFESAGGRVTVEVVRGVRVHAGYAQDKNNRDDQSTGRITAGVWASDIAHSGFDLSVNDNRMDRPEGTFDAWNVSLGRNFGQRLYVTADYSNSLSIVRFAGTDGTVIESRPRTRRYGLSGVWNASRGVSFLFSAEQYQDDTSTDDRGTMGLTYRF